MIKAISKLGPGLLFAGAAIGVSHLVQSTRAGADFGFGLIWALILLWILAPMRLRTGPQIVGSMWGRALLNRGLIQVVMP